MGSLLAALALVACGNNDPAAGVQVERSLVVYSSDARREYFDERDTAVRKRLAEATVALIPNQLLAGGTGSLMNAPTLRDSHEVCPGEPFVEQPAAAFCSGVLVDWDLVLTAGHCLRLLPLSKFSVVFNYYYVSEGTLALTPDSIATPVEIVAEALDAEGRVPRRDYAWLRLARAVSRRSPVALRRNPALVAGDPLISIGAPYGIPLKIENAGSISDAHEGSGYFTAFADLSAGWSGGPGFGSALDLIGIFARGTADWTMTTAACNAEVHLAQVAPAGEEFTYAAIALDGLCEADSSSTLCRQDCGEPCVALSFDAARSNGRPQPSSRGGCAFSNSASESSSTAAVSLVAVALANGARRRRARRARCTSL